MIPKIIHYCWYGHNPKSKLILHCINSWKEYFPDYEIHEWNEENTNLEENQYIKTAYANKKWAFVSDYVRMKVLYEYGGIYFDTDVEVIKKFPKDLFTLSAFSGIESFSMKVNPGLVFACEPQNILVGKMLDSYNKDTFDSKSVDKIKTINIRITELLLLDGFEEKDEKQIINGITIFPSSVFCGYDGIKRQVDVKEDTLSVHHYAYSWFPWYRKVRTRLGTLKRRIIFLKNKG